MTKNPLSLHFGYLIVIPTSDKRVSTLQHFSQGVLSHSWILHRITQLPSCVPELLSPKRDMRRFRMMGLTPYAIYILEQKYLSDFRVPERQPFFVAFSTKDTVAAVSAWVESFEWKPLHVSTERAHGALPALDRTRLRRHVREIAVACGHPHLAAQVASHVGWRKRCFLNFTRTAHNTSLPNEHCLLSAGYAFRSVEHIVPNIRDAESQYVEAMRRSAKKIAETRRTLGAQAWPCMPGLIITLPGINRKVIDRLTNHRRLKLHPDGVDIRDALVAIRDQSGYSFTLCDRTASKLLQASATRSLFAERTEELNAYTAGLEVRASSELAAVYRLPPRVDACRADFVRVGHCYRGASAKRKPKLRKELDRLRDRLRASVGASLYEVLAGEPKAVRIVADLPLEWLPSLDGLPLMLTHDTSRIATLPGDLALQQLLPKRPIALKVETFKRVLVLRSFDKGDLIRNDLAQALEVLEKSALGFSARVVDVTTSDEFVQALNDFDGAVLVFDGHGRHEGEHGTLQIGKQSIDIWQLRIRGRVPPIVILSACDTHPLDRTYASVANGFLAAGARTVIGSLLPIQAREASSLAFRILHAALRMVPMLLNGGYPVVRWSQVFSRTLRSQLMVELISAIGESQDIANDRVLEARMRATMMVALDHPTWFRDGLSVIGNATGISPTNLRRLIDEHIVVPQCTLYTQLGDPESIVIGEHSATPLDLLSDV